MNRVCDELEWAELVMKAGFTGDPERLLQAMTEARERFSTGVTDAQIADDPEKFRALFESINRLMGATVSGRVIREALLAMPRVCTYCEEDAWEWCNDCGGCPECCLSEIHCPHCGGSELICGCPIHCRCR